MGSIAEQEEEKQIMQPEEFSTDKFDAKTRTRVHVRARIYPGLPVFRSLGDFVAHKMDLQVNQVLGVFSWARVIDF